MSVTDQRGWCQWWEKHRVTKQKYLFALHPSDTATLLSEYNSNSNRSKGVIGYCEIEQTLAGGSYDRTRGCEIRSVTKRWKGARGTRTTNYAADTMLYTP